MPGGDRTGPMGAGPMTGRGAGFCAGYNVPGFANPVGGRGLGFGRGRGGFGRGFGRGWGRGAGWGAGGGYGWSGYGYGQYAQPAAPTKEQEVEGLRNEAQFLKDSLEQINQRLAELESKE